MLGQKMKKKLSSGNFSGLAAVIRSDHYTQRNKNLRRLEGFTPVKGVTTIVPEPERRFCTAPWCPPLWRQGMPSGAVVGYASSWDTGVDGSSPSDTLQGIIVQQVEHSILLWRGRCALHHFCLYGSGLIILINLCGSSRGLPDQPRRVRTAAVLWWAVSASAAQAALR